MEIEKRVEVEVVQSCGVVRLTKPSEDAGTSETSRKTKGLHRTSKPPRDSALDPHLTSLCLQTALALSPEQVAALPPPTLRIRQLEQENSKLLRENDELRRQLHMQTRRPSLMTDPHFDMARRGSFHSSVSADYPDRDLKRRRMSQNVDEVYLVIVIASHRVVQSPSQTPSPPTSEALARPSNFSPPPLSHGGYLPSSSTNTLPAMSTPSSTSTPTSYSANCAPYRALDPSDVRRQQQPGHENPSSHSLVGGHGLSSSRSLPLSGASQYPSSHYDSVKVEEDYMSPTQESSQNMSYSPVHSFSHHPHQAELSSWHSYSADRTQIHP
ncbi:hypothetical protein EDB87DRAFT_1728381 [Lactarius vividus]|nr:hypothetical protein EDB87DRAFT_1728381 [Lactarius vividus]